MFKRIAFRGASSLWAGTFLFVGLCWTCVGQRIDVAKDRVPLSELSVPWRFHIGDDSHWSDPELDDTSWSLLDPARPWDEQGFQGYRGFAWYRLRVDGLKKQTPDALLIPSLMGSYSVFVNGIPLGGAGHFAPQSSLYIARNQLYRLPQPGNALVVAIRVWYSPNWRYQFIASPGLSAPVPIFGSLERVAEWRSLREKAVVWSLSSTTYTVVLKVIALLAGLTLILLRPSDREYLWFTGIQLVDLLHNVVDLWVSSHPFSVMTYMAVFGATNALSDIFLVLLVFRLLGVQHRWFFRVVLICALLEFPGEVLCILRGLNALTFYYSITFCLAFLLLLQLGRSLRTHQREAPLLTLYLFLGYGIESILWLLRQLNASVHSSAVSRVISISDQVSDWPFGLIQICLWGGELSLLGILIARFDRARREQQRLSVEIDAARTVQQVLVSERVPAIPGLVIAYVYKPAGEVGGDFFQVVHTAAGDALIAIGDVSGKGMPAAMSVSLLVGTFRTLAHYTQSPSEILSAMNDRMLARSKDGFTTCLILKIAADGRVVFANAGHIPPFLDVAEVTSEGGLPLGLVAEAAYPEMSFMLGIGQQLTVLTDGVVEAKATKTDELFGFARTAAACTQTAETIANEAIQFGQEDDITVVTIRREASIESSLKPTEMRVLPEANAALG